MTNDILRVPARITVQEARRMLQDQLKCPDWQQKPGMRLSGMVKVTYFL